LLGAIEDGEGFASGPGQTVVPEGLVDAREKSLPSADQSYRAGIR
jgi:hypothetical protein